MQQIQEGQHSRVHQFAFAPHRQKVTCAVQDARVDCVMTDENNYSLNFLKLESVAGRNELRLLLKHDKQQVCMLLRRK